MSHTCCQRVKWGPIHDRSFCTAVPASSSFSHILYAPADRYQLLQNSAHKRNSRTICDPPVSVQISKIVHRGGIAKRGRLLVPVPRIRKILRDLETIFA